MMERGTQKLSALPQSLPSAAMMVFPFRQSHRSRFFQAAEPVFSNRRMSLKERERQEDDGSFLGLICERSLAAAGTDLGLGLSRGKLNFSASCTLIIHPQHALSLQAHLVLETSPLLQAHLALEKTQCRKRARRVYTHGRLCTKIRFAWSEIVSRV